MSIDNEFSVSDASSLHRWRTEIPNIIDEMGLSVYAFRLYFKLKRVAGDNGKCYYSAKQLSEQCNMSVGSISNAKQELLDANLIRIERANERSRDNITIVDMWPANFASFTRDDDEFPNPRPARQRNHLVINNDDEQSPHDYTNHQVITKQSPHDYTNHQVITKEDPIKEDLLKEEPKKKGEAQTPSPIDFGNIPQMQYRNRTKQFIDGLAQQRDRLGLNAAQFTALTDSILENMNAKAIADQDTDFGTRELSDAQQAALALAGLGIKTAAAVQRVFDTWYSHDFRGVKGSVPTYKQVVEHARGMEKIVQTRTNASSQMSDEKKAALKTAARMARESIASAKKFKTSINPMWQKTIEAAQAAGL
jgi:hypothetical protein